MPGPDFHPSDTAPSYQRELPGINLGRSWAIALLLFLLGFAAWEWKWRAFGAEPTTRNSDGLWSSQRRRLDHGEQKSTVLLGSSRVLFDVQLHAWDRALGERPIQLAMEGTTPLSMLEDLAGDPKFAGRLLVGVSPDVFFTGFGYREGVVKYYRNETLAQRAGQWLSLHFIEPFFAFYDDDFKLTSVLKRQTWPAREGVKTFLDVRKLTNQGPDRNTQLWEKVEKDAAYRELCRSVWAQSFDEPIPGMETPADLARVAHEQIDRTVAAAATLRGRGVPIVFLRAPSTGPYLATEDRDFPRAKTWDLLLARTRVPGIHFEDYPELQGYELPEWSHLSASEAERFTGELAKILRRDFGW